MSSFVFSTFSSIFESYLTTYRSYTAGSSPTSTYQLLTSTQQKGEKQKPNQVAQNACFVFFFFLIYLLIYLFMAVLGLRFCARAFSSCGKWGPLFIAVRGPLTIAASLVAEHKLQTHRLSSCGSRAQSLRGMWDLPRPGLEPVSPALVGRFSTTAPPGKPCFVF